METKTQEQAATRIRAETTVIQAEFQRQVKVIKAGGKANYTVTTKKAAALAIQNKLDAESEIMGSIKGLLGLAADGLVTYQQYAAVGELLNSTIFYGFEDTRMLISNGGIR